MLSSLLRIFTLEICLTVRPLGRAQQIATSLNNFRSSFVFINLFIFILLIYLSLTLIIYLYFHSCHFLGITVDFLVNSLILFWIHQWIGTELRYTVSISKWTYYNNIKFRKAIAAIVLLIDTV